MRGTGCVRDAPPGHYCPVVFSAHDAQAQQYCGDIAPRQGIKLGLWRQLRAAQQAPQTVLGVAVFRAGPSEGSGRAAGVRFFSTYLVCVDRRPKIT